MSQIVQVDTVKDTRLWKILDRRTDADSRFLSVNILELCQEAVERMKAMYAHAPQYTLHDDRHLIRVTELMEHVLGSEVDHLNSIELALLILSAFFHDQGMVLTNDERLSLDANEDFQVFRDNWRIEHPNYGETATQLSSCIGDEAQKVEMGKQLAELDAAMLTDYIRKTHGSRSKEYVQNTYASDKRLQIQNVNLIPWLAKLCESHTLQCDTLTPQNGFRYDEQIGTYTINIPFLAVVLRLADILDFDRDRTPESLLASIHFTSSVSLGEWEKHRSIEGWCISPDLIRFTAKCKHPAYEAAVRDFMDWIDSELVACKHICDNQPRTISGYQLKLPVNVDRSRIEPLDGAYRFHNLEFSLSRNEIVRLLMTDKLYGNEHLCIRELLQNALDALRYRKALFALSRTHWDAGKVDFRHYVNTDGHEVVECADNGVGMDDEIISNHFVKVGRSFYRSPSFERERNRLRASGNDFDPCSRFGIGFMSCFMLGDRITITTRRDYGEGRAWGPPLVVEIQGLSGLIIVRKGLANQPIGTRVSVVLRKKPLFFDSWRDKIQLCTVLKGYALATEFPITGLCDIAEIKNAVTIPPAFEITPTDFERAKFTNCITLHQDLSVISPCLGGFVRDSFLTDSKGLPCLANSEAEWRGTKDSGRKDWKLISAGAKPTQNARKEFESTSEGIEFSVPVCMDGILVTGTPGRFSYRKDVRMRLGFRNSEVYSHARALIDARGDLKPEITPARVPLEHSITDRPLGWRRLDDAFKQGSGLLWEQLAHYLSRGLSPGIFWKLAVIYDISVPWIPHNTLWETISVMLLKEGGNSSWKQVQKLGALSMEWDSKEALALRDREGLLIGPDTALDFWEMEGEERSSLRWMMNMVTILMSDFDIHDAVVRLRPLAPRTERAYLGKYVIRSRFEISTLLVEYAGNASDALAIESAFPTANRSHPLVKLFHESQYVSEPNDIQSFVNSFIPCISQSVSTKKGTLSLDDLDYWHKCVGHYFFAVQWDRYDASLRPPYKLWTKGRGWFSLTEEDFSMWRNVAATIR